MLHEPRPSPKQHVRIWFEFYKLALVNPDMTGEVRASKSYYEPWGDVQDSSFDQWWLRHSTLFDSGRITVINEVRPSDAVIHIRVPLGMAPSEAGQQLATLIRERQTDHLGKLGQIAGKTSKVGFSQFRLTPGTEFRGQTAEAALQVYRDIYLPLGSPPIGQQLAAEVTSFYRLHPRRRVRLTSFDRSQRSDFTDEQIRQLRRCISRARDLMLAAAKGDFPGKSRST
ncbi:MAG: hypothetical protein JST16_03915 [Bdellovibrionales bacterium]|nr:hypothetical protein [Bdellovibrionales bacterium]